LGSLLLLLLLRLRFGLVSSLVVVVFWLVGKEEEEG